MKISGYAAGKQVESSTRLVVIAASAGGLAPMTQLLSQLPASFPAAIAVVQHRSASQPDRLVRLLAKATRLHVCHAQSGALLEAGTVYVCPPGMHMAVGHHAELYEGPKVAFVQPNADLMLDSVARAYGARAASVVLSGTGADAALGSHAVMKAGGLVLVQSEDSCRHSGMPGATTQVGAAAGSLGAAEIARALVEWVGGSQRYTAIDPRERSAPISVLLVDDHRILLDGVKILIEAQPDMRVVGEAADAATATRLMRELTPSVVVMDVRMPGTDGVDATRNVLAEHPSAQVLALSSESTPTAVDRMFRAGARGYVTKNHAFDELVEAIRAVARGGVYMSREVAELVARGRVRAPARTAVVTPVNR